MALKIIYNIKIFYTIHKKSGVKIEIWRSLQFIQILAWSIYGFIEGLGLYPRTTDFNTHRSKIQIKV